jgi:two-component system cell cycle sensor histidine kinase/response regulator CckA
MVTTVFAIIPVILFTLIILVREKSYRRIVAGLKISERKYRLFFERSIDILYRTDRNGIITLISPSVEKILGFRPDELIGKPMRDFYRDPALRTVFLELLMQNETVDNFEVDIKKSDGGYISISINAIMLRDEHGEFDGVEGITRDISQIKLAQSEKFMLEENLRHNQKMDSIGTLAGGIAHDFNNILTAIIGFAEMAQQKVDPADPLAQDIAGILRSGLRAKELVRHILIFSRKSTYEPTPVDLHLAVKEALHLIRATISPAIGIKEQFRYRSGKVLADPTEIHQVIMNFCSNAAHAMEDNGGTLTVSLDRIELTDDKLPEEYHMESGFYLMLRIADTGHGIIKEHMDRVFDPFFTTKEIGKGNGMGLAIVHGIIRRLNGMIKLESTEGKGTTFTVYLQEHTTPQPAGAGNATHPAKGNEHILFVDDEAFVTDVTRRGLELLGYRVTSFTVSEEALKAFRQNPDVFDCVITDQTMPKMNGGKLAEKLLRIRPDIPIIMCTGYSAIMDAEKAGQIGIRAFIMKPYDHKNLAAIVRKLLDSNE